MCVVSCMLLPRPLHRKYSAHVCLMCAEWLKHDRKSNFEVDHSTLKMPKYVLHYFNTKGRAEIIRLILKYVGAEFEDKRYSKEEWLQIKNNDKLFPFAQMPVLEVDGQPIAQSFGIARYLANKYDLAGKTDMHKALADSIFYGLFDMIQSFIREVMYENDEGKKEEGKKKFYEETVPRVLKQVEKLSSQHGNGFLIGDSVTWVDFLLVLLADRHGAQFFDSVPTIKAIYEKTKNLPQIQEYLSSRPETPM